MDPDANKSAGAVHPGAVMIPSVVTVVTAAAAIDITHTATQAQPQADQDHGSEKNLSDVFHGRSPGLALSTYCTRPTAPPVGSVMTAKRLPSAAGCGATRTFPPSVITLAAASSISATRTHPIQPGRESALTGRGATPARARPPLENNRCSLFSARASAFTSSPKLRR